MKASTIFCLLTLPLVVGCSTTFYVPRDPGASEFTEAKGNMEGRTGVVTEIIGAGIFTETIGGSRTLVQLAFRADTLVGYDYDTHAVIVLPLSKVEKIDLTSVMRGLGRGALWGIAIGGGIGLIGASTDHDPQPIFSKAATFGICAT